MGFRCGIVGLPNVGKSTLFNALTKSKAANAANYPFCTIDPNIGNISVPDNRLEKLAAIAGSDKIIPTQINFVDIAGLVEGASKGEGLGNQFLGHIREVDAIAYVLRCFDDENIAHVAGNIDPVRDAEIIKLELIYADIESLQKRLPNVEKKAKQDKEMAKQADLIKEMISILVTGEMIIYAINKENKEQILALQLLTSKPFFYICNVGENDVATGNHYTKKIEEMAEAEGVASVIISAQIESEISLIENKDDRDEFLKAIGLETSGLDKIIQCGYEALDLITFYTIGPKEAHAWTLKAGETAPKAAGVIHSDFEKGFIRAEIIQYDDYVMYKGESGVKDIGKLRLEGKEYIMQDGDIVHFRFNV